MAPEELLWSPRIILKRTVVGRLSRRRIAPLIRIRQELDKRLDPLFPWRAGPDALERLFNPELARVARSSADRGDGLRQALASRASVRFPLEHLSGRNLGELPAREALGDSITGAANGRWSVFGTPVTIDATMAQM